jgi:hypothetical protein
MKTHEGNRKGRRPLTAAIALAGALALAVPGVAGAGIFSSKTYSAPTTSLTITQNTSMIVNVSASSTTTVDAVSWSDVSWSDAYLVN